MNVKRLLIVALLLLAAGLTFNQWLLHKQMQRLRLNAIRPNHPEGDPFERPDDAAAKLRQAE